MFLQRFSSRTRLCDAHIYSYATLSVFLFLLSVISALPLQAEGLPTNPLIKRAMFEYLSCPGPLPIAPYPGAPIYMAAAHINPFTHVVTSLVYLDNFGEIEYILHRESLCSRAGCKCTQGDLVCNNFDYAFFSRTINMWYAANCWETCSCIKQNMNIPDVSILRLKGGGNLTVVESPEVVESGKTNPVSRLNPTGTAFGFQGCLAGEATGWILQRLAKCCLGYTFHALTAQEAYETYGVAPYVSASDVVASAYTIGVCLKITNP